MSRVGEKIKLGREAKGLSQKQLGRKLGVAEKFINDVETGRKIANQNIIDRLSKVLGVEINDLSSALESETYKEDNKVKYSIPSKPAQVNSVWSDAFSDILKDVPIYDYSLSKCFGVRKLPVVNNKIEGHPKDKVAYLKVEDDDMIGFRIQEGDLVFGHMSKSIDNNAILLLEYNGNRAIRQVKKLDGSKILLVSNRGSVRTETVSIKDVKPILRLDKIEISLA